MNEYQEISKKTGESIIDAWCLERQIHFSNPEMNSREAVYWFCKAIRCYRFMYRSRNLWVVIDNSSDECFVESFRTQSGAISYINGKEPEKIKSWVKQ